MLTLSVLRGLPDGSLTKVIVMDSMDCKSQRDPPRALDFAY